MGVGFRWLLVLALVGVESRQGLSGQTLQPSKAPAMKRRLSQSQVAGKFLHAILRADFQKAYGLLAPEVRQNVNLGRFEIASRPLWKSGQQHGNAIELYKLGVRLGDGNASRLFYSFSFAADSSLKVPSALLEVTFRDTASRGVLGFAVRIPAKPAGKEPAALKSNQK